MIFGTNLILLLASSNKALLELTKPIFSHLAPPSRLYCQVPSALLILVIAMPFFRLTSMSIIALVARLETDNPISTEAWIFFAGTKRGLSTGALFPTVKN